MTTLDRRHPGRPRKPPVLSIAIRGSRVQVMTSPKPPPPLFIVEAKPRSLILNHRARITVIGPYTDAPKTPISARAVNTSVKEEAMAKTRQNTPRKATGYRNDPSPSEEIGQDATRQLGDGIRVQVCGADQAQFSLPDVQGRWRDSRRCLCSSIWSKWSWHTTTYTRPGSTICMMLCRTSMT